MIAWPEGVITVAAFFILAAYHLYFAYQVRNHPLDTSVGLTNRLRREWVQTVMEGKRDILAVQTMRNWIMTSSFLASTAILIGLGLISVAFNEEYADKFSHALNFFGTKSHQLWLAKLLVLVVDFFFSFFNFTLSIRYYNHASVAINVPPSMDPIVDYDTVTRIINHGSLHYTLGMRGYYLAIPFTLWLFGAAWMLLGVVILTPILYNLDRTA